MYAKGSRRYCDVLIARQISREQCVQHVPLVSLLLMSMSKEVRTALSHRCYMT